MGIYEKVAEFASLPVIEYQPATGLVLPVMPRREFRPRETSDQFWAISLATDRVTVWSGKVGTDGEKQTHVFASPVEAQQRYRELVARQVADGWVPLRVQREFRLASGRTSRFWTVTVAGRQRTVVSGKAGTDGLPGALAGAPVLGRIRVLDLSLGTLTDAGAEALLAVPGLARLEKLDIHHHYVSPGLVERLQALGIQVDASDPREPEDFGVVILDLHGLGVVQAAFLRGRAGLGSSGKRSLSQPNRSAGFFPKNRSAAVVPSSRSMP